MNQKVRGEKKVYSCAETVYGLEYSPNGNMVAVSTLRGDQPWTVVLGENLQGNWEVLQQ